MKGPMKDWMTFGECNINADTTTEMTLRLQGGMQNDESMTSLLGLPKIDKRKENHPSHVVK